MRRISNEMYELNGKKSAFYESQFEQVMRVWRTERLYLGTTLYRNEYYVLVNKWSTLAYAAANSKVCLHNVSHYEEKLNTQFINTNRTQ